MDSGSPDAIIAEIKSLIDAGNIEDAVRLSGEELAHADNRLRKTYNEYAAENRRPDDVLKARVNEVAVLGVAHCNALIIGGAHGDAYATALTVMLAIDMCSAACSHAVEMLALSVIATAALDELTDHIPQDDFAREHMPHIITCLASMMYAYYRATPSPGTVWHTRAYPRLQEFAGMGAIQQQSVDPSHPSPVLADLIGRSIALSLIPLQN